jgi:CHAD domain-containing protein
MTGPTSAPAALAARVALDLARRAEAVGDARHRVAERAGGEAIHDLRVSSRRLGEALRAWRGALPRHEARALVRRVERLRRALGDARDAEVRFETLRALVRTAPRPERPGALPLLRTLAETMYVARGKAARAAHAKGGARLADEVAALAWRLGNAGPDEASDAALLASARAHLARRREKLKKAEATLASTRSPGSRTGLARLHAVRICAKRTRYALECLTDVAAPEMEAVTETAGRTLSRLRARQRRLGAVCDLASLVRWLSASRRGGAANAAGALERRAWLARSREAQASALRGTARSSRAPRA